MAVQDSIIFDPTAEELAVAESVLAVTVAEVAARLLEDDAMDVDTDTARDLRVLAIRTIDPPSRLTFPGVADFMNTATGGVAAETMQKATLQKETMTEHGVWQPPRGGMKRKLMASMLDLILHRRGGVAAEVLDGLETVELG